MISVGNFLLNYLANSLWQIPLFLVMAYVLERLLRRAGLVIRHRLWVATLILAITMPAIGAATKVVSITRPAGVTAAYEIKVNGAQGVLSHPASLQLSPVAFNLGLIVYLAVTLAATLRLVNSVRRTYTLVRNARPVLFDVDDVIARATPRKQVALLCSDGITTPVTIGWRKPILLVPTNIREWRSDDAAAALAHECAHIDRHDFVWNLLYEALSVPISYHPMLRSLKSRVSASRETICDAIAAERVTTPVSYAHSLLRIASTIIVRPAEAPAIGMFDGNVLEKRIMELTEAKRLLNRGLKSLAIVSAVAVFAAACVTTTVLAFDIGQKTTTDTVIQSDNNPPAGCCKTDGEATKPTLITKVNPSYPPKAKEEKRTGTCILEVSIDEKGVPQEVKVVSSSAPDFEDSAVNAVKQWRFSPATLKGKPVPAMMRTEVNFKLN